MAVSFFTNRFFKPLILIFNLTLIFLLPFYLSPLLLINNINEGNYGSIIVLLLFGYLFSRFNPKLVHIVYDSQNYQRKGKPAKLLIRIMTESWMILFSVSLLYFCALLAANLFDFVVMRVSNSSLDGLIYPLHKILRFMSPDINMSLELANYKIFGIIIGLFLVFIVTYVGTIIASVITAVLKPGLLEISIIVYFCYFLYQLMKNFGVIYTMIAPFSLYFGPYILGVPALIYLHYVKSGYRTLSQSRGDLLKSFKKFF